MNQLNMPSPSDLDDAGFVTSQMFTWASKAFRLGFEDMRARDPEAAARVALAIQNGVAHVETRLDLGGATASFILNLDGGEPLELFASIPAPKETLQ